jgi:hypothetical protein
MKMHGQSYGFLTLLHSVPLAMKKSTLLSLLLLPTLLLLVGCPWSEMDEIYNNSGQDLTLIRTSSGQYRGWTNVVRNGESVGCYPPITLIIRERDATWNYGSRPSWGVFHKKSGDKQLIKFYKETSPSQLLIKMQIQSDGSIYLLPPDSSAPATNFPSQPEGFPLKPE